MNPTFTFEGLEALEGRIRRLNRDAAFIIIWDRTDPAHDENLARFDLDPAYALPYLVEHFDPALQEERSELEDEDDDASDDDEQAEGSEPEDGAAQPGALQQAMSPRSAHKLSFSDVLEAACRWIRDVAVRNTLGEQFRRFRVRVYGPKGMRQVETGTFLVRNQGWKTPATREAETAGEEALPAPVAMPQPSFDESALTGAAKSVKVLGDLYSQWGHIVLGGVGQLQGVNNAMIGKLHQQLTESRDQVDQLVASILEFRVSQLNAAESRNVQNHQEETRTALARDALRQLGDAAKAFLSARGVTPELAEVVNTLGGSPELMAALNDPDVRELLRDPNNLQLLAGLLKQFGAQNRAARAGLPPQGTMPGQPPAQPSAPQPAAG